MKKLTKKDLLAAGVHIGHPAGKWNPGMREYIFCEKNGTHIINLEKTVICLDLASDEIRRAIKQKKKILVVGTKSQAKEAASAFSERLGMPCVTQKWTGGMMTNFATFRKSIAKMDRIDKMVSDGTFDNLSKRERLQITRQREKLEKNLGGVSGMTRLPQMILIIDANREHVAVAEAKKLGVPIIALVDTNSDPAGIDFPIPANDDSPSSIRAVLEYILNSLEEEETAKELQAEESTQNNDAIAVAVD